MALLITDECINCDVCEPECPNGRHRDGRRLLRDRSEQMHGVRRPFRRTPVPPSMSGRLHSVESRLGRVERPVDDEVSAADAAKPIESARCQAGLPSEPRQGRVGMFAAGHARREATSQTRLRSPAFPRLNRRPGVSRQGCRCNCIVARSASPLMNIGHHGACALERGVDRFLFFPARRLEHEVDHVGLPPPGIRSRGCPTPMRRR